MYYSLQYLLSVLIIYLPTFMRALRYVCLKALRKTTRKSEIIKEKKKKKKAR